MKHRLAIVLAVGLATPAFADVTLKQTTSGKGLGRSGTAAVTTYIRGHKMRSESKTGDQTQVTIFDVDGQKMYVFESGKKEADVWDMSAFEAELSKSVRTGDMKASLKPNGQTKQIAGQNATGYDLEIVVPTSMGGRDDMTVTVNMTGPIWIVKNAPGSADYIRFYKAATEKAWVFTTPQSARGLPGPAKAMAEMYKQFADAGGIPYETDMEIKMSGGSGSMVRFLAKLGTMSMASTVDAVETTALADDLFAPPAGFKLNVKK